LAFEIWMLCWFGAFAAAAALAWGGLRVLRLRRSRRARRSAAEPAAAFAIQDVPAETFRLRSPATGRVKGDLGELAAGLAAASEGWRWVDVKWGRDRGVDGLFVRENPKRAGETEVLLVEVKNTNARPELPARQLTDTHLVNTLNSFWTRTGDEQAAKRRLVEQVIAALKTKRPPANLTRELWWVRMDEMAIDVFRCGRRGEPIGPMQRRKHEALFNALAVGLPVFDREAIYLVPPPPETPPPPEYRPRYRSQNAAPAPAPIAPPPEAPFVQAGDPLLPPAPDET